MRARQDRLDDGIEEMAPESEVTRWCGGRRRLRAISTPTEFAPAVQVGLASDNSIAGFA